MRNNRKLIDAIVLYGGALASFGLIMAIVARLGL